ncbi:MAG TPA: hypothetical protein VMW08_03190 [Acidimicrobiales bacterium]|nr:hypothetical protein [Acidimicrobiales bacterium]
MQVTNTQVDKTLESLSRSGPTAPAVEGPLRLDALLDEAITRVNDLPTVRRERAEMARDRLRAEQLPSAEALADKLIGRLVCDRLR